MHYHSFTVCHHPASCHSASPSLPPTFSFHLRPTFRWWVSLYHTEISVRNTKQNWDRFSTLHSLYPFSCPLWGSLILPLEFVLHLLSRPLVSKHKISQGIHTPTQAYAFPHHCGFPMTSCSVTSVTETLLCLPASSSQSRFYAEIDFLLLDCNLMIMNWVKWYLYKTRETNMKNRIVYELTSNLMVVLFMLAWHVKASQRMYLCFVLTPLGDC